MKGTLYPNGEFTVSTLPERRLKVDRFHRPKDEWQDEYERLVRTHIDLFGLQETIDVVQSFEDATSPTGVLDVLGRGESWEECIGSSNVLNSKKRASPAPRGSKGISSHARRLVRNGAFCIEQKNDLPTISFLTLTIPVMSAEDFAVFMRQHWSKVTHKFFIWLRYRLEQAGLPPEWVGVTEIQVKRMSRQGLPYPHLHVIFKGRKGGGTWAIAPREFRAEWRKLILSTGLSSIPQEEEAWKACENVQRVEKSVERYLGKYLSKGVSMSMEDIPKDMRGMLPSNWHFVSQPVKDWVAKNRRSSERLGEILACLIEREVEDVFLWLSPIAVDWGDSRLHLGYVGKVPLPMAARLISLSAT